MMFYVIFRYYLIWPNSGTSMFPITRYQKVKIQLPQKAECSPELMELFKFIKLQVQIGIQI